MSEKKPRVGDLVVATSDCDRFFSSGDKAKLLYADSDGDWWGDFTMNDDYEGDGIWIISPQHFKLSGA